jgi:signal transduction histidine kinase
VDLSAYRIVQEALTNTLKHARRPVEAFVTVRFSQDALEIEILDDGKGTAVVDGSRTHNGLVGMRERVALDGGKLDCGPRPEEGFFVRASFALDGGTH